MELNLFATEIFLIIKRFIRTVILMDITGFNTIMQAIVFCRSTEILH